jgi:hypothetical protein
MPPTETIPPNTPSTVVSMLNALAAEIASALQGMQSALPRNPGLNNQIQAKILMLQSPSLKSDIIGGQFWDVLMAKSLNGGSAQLSVVFPRSVMRTDASHALQEISQALPLLEGFMSLPFPYTQLDVWYGFVIGNTGGHGDIDVEDQQSYEGRITTTMAPYDATLYHELAHNYLAHEALTQFLEVYLYNMVRTRSTEVRAWVYTRGAYTAVLDSNNGVQALMDIYQMVGPDAMSRAYRRLYVLQPPYGQPLSDQCKQVFIDQAPDALRVQVAAKVATIVY